MASLVLPDTNHPVVELHFINSKQTTTNPKDIFMDQVSTPEILSHHRTHNHLDSLDLKAIYLVETSNNRSQVKDSNKTSNKTNRFQE